MLGANQALASDMCSPQFATIATLLECFMRNRDIIVENLGNAPTPVDQLEKLEEGLAQADNQDDANNNNQICTRYEKESHPKCSICKKGAKVCFKGDKCSCTFRMKDTNILLQIL